MHTSRPLEHPIAVTIHTDWRQDYAIPFCLNKGTARQALRINKIKVTTLRTICFKQPLGILITVSNIMPRQATTFGILDKHILKRSLNRLGEAVKSFSCLNRRLVMCGMKDNQFHPMRSQMLSQHSGMALHAPHHIGVETVGY